MPTYASSARRNLLLARPGFWATPALLVLSMAIGACGGGGGSDLVASGVAPAPVSPSPISPPAVIADDSTLAASQPGDLLAYFQQNLRRSAERIASSPVLPSTGSGAVALTGSVTAAPAPAPAPAPASASNAPPVLAMSGTTLQEAGVDEDDWLKTDGNMLYAISRDRMGAETLVASSRLPNGSVSPAATLTLAAPGSLSRLSGMHYAASARRIAVLGERFSATTAINLPAPAPAPGSASGSGSVSIAPGVAGAPQITLDLIDTANKDKLGFAANIRLDGTLIGSRMIGSTIYLVTRHAPSLKAQSLPEASRDAGIAALTAVEILPTVSVNGVTETLVKETDCYLQRTNAAIDLQLTSITAIDLASPTFARKSRCFAGGSESVYVSTQSIYLATSRFAPVSSSEGGISPLIFAPNISTDIHKFSLNGLDTVYRGSGNVPGHLGWDAAKKPYRMGEFNGDLRVLSFTGERGWMGDVVPSATGSAKPVASPAQLSVLREQGGKLNVVASLPNARRPAPIGLPGEQVYAVRFLGPRAYVVTFRRTDPLYVLDLSDPLDPQITGELKAPGFSDYLIPLGDSLLLGVGKDATDSGLVQGVKVALFDMRNPALPLELTQRTIGQRFSVSALDYSSHGINVLMTGGRARIALPVRVYDKPASSLPSHQALYRYEVDLSTRQMTDKPMLQSADFSALPTSAAFSLMSVFDMARERSVQFGDFFYYLSGGEVRSGAW